MRLMKCYGKRLIVKELEKSFDFFLNEVNTNQKSYGYGLIRDKTMTDDNIASIASVGYGLVALIIGIEHKWIDYDKAYERASKTLDTFINHVDGKNGFYYHFVNMQNGKREWNCEISIIDTAIFICGAITAGEYFGKEVKEKAEILYKKMNWEWFRDKENNYFYIGYTPEENFCGHWDRYAEQLILYVLGVSSPTFPVDKSMYDSFERNKADYKDIEDIIYTYCGTLFTYQYSHAWIDFRNQKDRHGIDWFENSVKATKANRQYCIDHKERFKTYGENAWGLTACLSPKGYIGCGANPCGVDLDIENDGTISPCGAIGSIVFTPEEYKSNGILLQYFSRIMGKIWFERWL